MIFTTLPPRPALQSTSHCPLPKVSISEKQVFVRQEGSSSQSYRWAGLTRCGFVSCCAGGVLEPAPQLSPGSYLSDRDTGRCPEPLLHIVHVDSRIVFGADAKVVASAAHSADDRVREVGLPAHEV